jgi:hypothetical protein
MILWKIYGKYLEKYFHCTLIVIKIICVLRYINVELTMVEYQIITGVLQTPV